MNIDIFQIKIIKEIIKSYIKTEFNEFRFSNKNFENEQVIRNFKYLDRSLFEDYLFRHYFQVLFSCINDNTGEYEYDSQGNAISRIYKLYTETTTDKEWIYSVNPKDLIGRLYLTNADKKLTYCEYDPRSYVPNPVNQWYSKTIYQGEKEYRFIVIDNPIVEAHFQIGGFDYGIDDNRMYYTDSNNISDKHYNYQAHKLYHDDQGFVERARRNIINKVSAISYNKGYNGMGWGNDKVAAIQNLKFLTNQSLQYNKRNVSKLTIWHLRVERDGKTYYEYCTNDNNKYFIDIRPYNDDSILCNFRDLVSEFMNNPNNQQRIQDFETNYYETYGEPFPEIMNYDINNDGKDEDIKKLGIALALLETDRYENMYNSDVYSETPDNLYEPYYMETDENGNEKYPYGAYNVYEETGESIEQMYGDLIYREHKKLGFFENVDDSGQILATETEESVVYITGNVEKENIQTTWADIIS